MTTCELIRAYNYNMTADIVIAMDNEDDNVTIFRWSAEDNRHPDDGSYSNVCYYIPDDIAKAQVDTFTVLPQYLTIDKEPIKVSDTETLYIVIPTYGRLYRYLDDDNYPFL